MIQYKFGEVVVLFCITHTTKLPSYNFDIYQRSSTTQKIQDPGVNPPPNLTLYYSTKLVTSSFMMLGQSFMEIFSIPKSY
jgi:hypothetical protein